MEKHIALSFFLLFLLFVEDVVSRRVDSPSNADGLDVDGKIFGGYNITTIQDVPYQVFLRFYENYKISDCAGSIISETYILTAAHCLTGKTIVMIRAGSILVNSGGSVYKSHKFRQHPLYNPSNSDYDVGLIKVTSGMQLDGQNTKAVLLPAASNIIAAGTNVLFAGWGITSEIGQTSENLKAIQILTISDDICRRVYPSLTSQQFCAIAPEGTRGPCKGDSGGPVVATTSGEQLGIFSMLKRGCGPEYPAVYTNVARVRTWITSVTGV